jgi:predicted alpha/beta-hydrolase family hydrolase
MGASSKPATPQSRPPRRPRPGALLLAPGAGADRTHHTLVAVAEAVAPLPARTFDFPYRKAGRRAPDKAPVAVAAVREEATALVAEAHIAPRRLVLGGRSFGGRMCSMAVAEGLPAAGLVLLSYPLHPPGKPDRLRTEHFSALDVPCLFVSGRKDPFGSPAEFEASVGAIPGPVTMVWLDGGHDPRNADGPVADAVVAWLRGLR